MFTHRFRRLRHRNRFRHRRFGKSPSPLLRHVRPQADSRYALLREPYGFRLWLTLKVVSSLGIISVEGHMPMSEDKEWDTFLTLSPLCRYAVDLPLLMSAAAPEASKVLRLEEPVSRGLCVAGLLLLLKEFNTSTPPQRA